MSIQKCPMDIFYAATKFVIKNVLSSGLWCCWKFASLGHHLYIIFQITSGSQKYLLNYQSTCSLIIYFAKMMLEILEILEKGIIGQKCPLDIFKGSMKNSKNHHLAFFACRTIYGATFETRKSTIFQNPKNPSKTKLPR